MKISLFLFPLTQALPASSPTRIASITDAFNTLVKSNNEKVMFHGCHCIGFIVPQGGIPVDERDQACMSWKASRSCVALKNGPCNDVSDRSYDWNGESCDDLDGCQKTLCEIDQYYSNKIQDFDTDLVFIASDEIGDQCKYGYVRPKFVDVFKRQTAFEKKENQYFPKPEVRIKGAFNEAVAEEINSSVDGSVRSGLVDEQQLIESGFIPEVQEDENENEAGDDEIEVEQQDNSQENTSNVEDIFRDWQENEKKFRRFQQHQQSLRDSEFNPVFKEPSFENVSKGTIRDSCCHIEDQIWRKYNSDTEVCEDGLVSPLVSYVN